MGIVILSKDGIEHRHVMGRIMDELGDQVDAIIISHPRKKGRVENIKYYWDRYSVPQLGSRFAASLYGKATKYHERRAAQYTRILFPDGDPGVVPGGDKVHIIAGHNSKACHELLDRFQPEIIVVYGTAIIKPPTIRKAGKAILNMHTGISPRYRGTDTAFWPLHNEEPEWVGVTIHHLDEGIDTGPILRTGKPEFAADDDDLSLFAKCVEVGAGLYIDVLRDALAGVYNGQPQALEDGNSYRGVDRTVRASLKVKKLIADGLISDYAARQKTSV